MKDFNTRGDTSVGASDEPARRTRQNLKYICIRRDRPEKERCVIGSLRGGDVLLLAVDRSHVGAPDDWFEPKADERIFWVISD